MICPPPDGGMWDRFEDQMKAKKAQKPEKLPQHVIATNISGLTNIKVGESDSKTSTEAKSSKGSGMEID